MRIWVIKDGEILPLDPAFTKMRTGLLAAELAKRGHDVIWWSSTFSHQRKVFMRGRDTEIIVDPRLKLKLLHVGGYRRNISIERVAHHKQLARRFAAEARSMERPDIIVSAFPIIEVAHAAVTYGAGKSVPVVIDVRDLWPDSLIERFPLWTRGVLKRLLAVDYRRTVATLRGADSLVAISKGCLQWALAKAGRQMCERDRVFYIGYPRSGESRPLISDCIQNTIQSLNGKVVFTYVGSFGHSYELNLICDVAGRVHRTGIDTIHFVIVGDGHQFGEIQKRVSFLPNVTLTGWLNKVDIDGILLRSDVGLVPCRSVTDAVSNKLAQYLSAGLPVVSSLQGEMESIITDHEIGYSYLPGDADALFKHIVVLATEVHHRIIMARNARALFYHQFLADDIYSAYANHVERMCIPQDQAIRCSG